MQPIYQQQAEQYAQEGYALFENVLQAPMLAMLREQCDVCLAREDARMDELGVDSVGLTHRGKRYFVAQCQRVQPVLRQLLFSSLMADVCRATLGFDAYFFLDQFVVKCADGGLPFSWHQDSGYVVGNGGPPDHLPYVSFWVPLDDTTAADGAVKLVPFSSYPRARSILPHRRNLETDDLATEVDESKVLTVQAAAGSILALSSRLLHATGPNPGSRTRRVYLAQYTPEVMVNPGTRHLRNNAIPVLCNGQHATFP
jgi:ectoine hydroxylase-related dioxygenase (phytanoyl-CoA dioxygenase family)